MSITKENLKKKIQTVLQQDGPILLFDGDCHLCHSSVQWILKHEKTHDIIFDTLQSKAGKLLASHYFESEKDIPDSILWVEKGRCFQRSSAALRLSRYLKFPFPLSQIFLLIPYQIRDMVYNFIAKNRFKWFGKVDSCIYDPSFSKRILQNRLDN